MGEVWLGQDRRLNRDVALKVVRPDLFANPTVRERFVREARHASSVVHPYVATVFDVVEQSGETILVMEYVEGENLKDIILDPEPPPIEERLRYGVEVAEALEAIHARGILHRDLKPGNVIVTPAGHVKVLDFGLAYRARQRPEANLSPELEETAGLSITAPGVAVGTIAYMSPEQIRGEKLDVRSDLFSLGIVLCELATTHHPFMRESAPKTVAAILEADPFSVASGTDTVAPAALQPVLARALSKTRDHRYTSAAEVAADLQAVLRGETARAARIAIERQRKRIGLMVSAAVLAVAVVAVAAWSWLRLPPDWNQPRVAVAFVPLDDRTGMADGPVRAAMVADLLATDLASSRIVRPIGPNETRTILAGLAPGASVQDVAQRLAGALNVDYVVRGVLYREGDRYVATLEAVSTHGGPSLAALRADGATASSVAESLAGSMRRALPGVSAITAVRDDRADLDALTSKSEDARVLFERGNLAWRDGRLGEAMEFLDKAIAADPDFALARATLAQVRHDAGYGRLAREEADRARAHASTGNTPGAERLRLTLDAVRAEVSEDAASFAEAAGKLAARYGDEPETLQLHAKALDAAGRGTEALAAIDRAIALDKSRPGLYLTRADILTHAERWDDALASVDTAQKIYGTLGSADGRAISELLRGGILLGAQRHEAAIASLTQALGELRALGRDNLAASASASLGGVYLMVGRPGQAEPLLASAAQQARTSGNLGLVCKTVSSQGAQAYIQADYVKAESLLRESVDQARQLQNDELLMDPLSNLTSLLSFVGRYSDARSLMDDLIERVTRSGQKGRILEARLNLANLDLMQGRLDESIQVYGEVLDAEGGGDAAGQNVPWARLGRAEVLQARGRLADAWADANSAVDAFDRLGATGFAGYARLRRGLVATELGRTKEATVDFGTADREARRDQAGLADLAARVEIARGLLAAGAARRPGKATEAAVAASPVLRAWHAATECEVRMLHGDAAGAEAACRRAFDDAAAQASDAIAARAARAEALSELHHFADARDDARRAFDDASRLGLPLPTARAAAILVGLPADLRPADAEPIRQRGKASLDAYLAGAPATDRERIESRATIARLNRVLGAPPSAASKTSISPPDTQGGQG